MQQIVFYEGIGRVFLNERIDDHQQCKEFAGELCYIFKNAGDHIDIILPHARRLLR
jgi:hypothetical protein